MRSAPDIGNRRMGISTDWFTRTVDGVTYAPDEPSAPRGPRGAAPDKLARFGVGTIDHARLGELLVSARDWVFANEMHAAIVEALNVDPNPLMIAYHWIEGGDIAVGAVHVTPGWSARRLPGLHAGAGRAPSESGVPDRLVRRSPGPGY
jgi:hypothetical protein